MKTGGCAHSFRHALTHNVAQHSELHSLHTAPVYAPPGILLNGRACQLNSYDAFSNRQFPGSSPFAIPLRADSTVQSPWGLLDTASGTKEWEEDPVTRVGANPIGRRIDGSAWGDGSGLAAFSDRISNIDSDYPSTDNYEYGFRIAAAIPAPTGVAVFIFSLTLAAQRRRD